ncbi:MAG: Zn-dependent hydrolase [Alphaproteobacteria bacterium]|nr:Zn-dependent hydrolase [Alphaproteobacteria bacterium]
MRNLRVDGSRLWDSLMEMAKIGALPNGGCGRLALSDEDKVGRDLFAAWCEAAGCSVAVDRMGNIFARRPGRDDSRPPVVTGSHLDTQPHGGRFDGVYGVLAGLEVVRALNDAGIETESPIEVAVWTNEEGARFAPSMVGSAVFAGAYSLDKGLACADADGATIGAELGRIGYAGERPCGGTAVGAYFEAHIEQGPILESEDKTIGVVTGGQGLYWYDVSVGGQDSHAGTTPMPRRRDAMTATAAMIIALRDIALDHAPDGVATAGEMAVSPNSRNTIAGRVDFTIDLRHPDDAVRHAMDRALRAALERIAAEHDVEVTVEVVADTSAVVFDAECVGAVRSTAAAQGYSHRDIVSGAGHDAFFLSRVAPTAMIFVPCRDGLSHNEAEDAAPADLEAGCNILLHAMLDRAGVA